MRYVSKIKEKCSDYWFVLAVWIEWLAIYLLRMLITPYYSLFAAAPDTSGTHSGVALPAFLTTSSDTWGYDTFETVPFFQSLQMTDQRGEANTPLYGILLDVLNVFFGEWRFVAVVILQIAVSAAALVYFYKTLELLGVRKNIAIGVILVYGFSTAASTWNVAVLTESLSISGFIFVLYNIFYYLRAGKLHNGMASVLITFGLVFLRPQFLLHYVVLLCFFLLKPLLEKPHKVSMILPVALVGGGVILGYCRMFMGAYGIFSLSTAKTRQDFYTCVKEGFYKSCSDKAFVNEIDEYLKAYEGKPEIDFEIVYHFKEKYGHDKVSQIARECLMQNIPAYGRYLIRSIYETSVETFNGPGIPETPLDTLKCGHAMMISCLQGLVMLVLWVLHKRPPWVHMGLFAFTFPVIWSTFIVTCGGFMRTMIYVVPPTYCSLALFAEWLATICKNRNSAVAPGFCDKV